MKIYGNTVGYPPQADWAQINESAPDFIRNKPDLEPLRQTGEDALALAQEALPRTGGVMTGPMNVQEPVEGSNPATKSYVDERVKTFTVTIPASGWYDAGGGVLQFDHLMPDILPTDEPIIDIAYLGRGIELMPEIIAEEEEFEKVYFAITGPGAMSFRAKERPERDLPIKIKVVR